MLKDIYLQELLEEQGFVKFKFLNSDSIQELTKLFICYEQEHKFHGKFHHSTFHIGKPELARIVDVEIQKIISPFIEKHFVSYNLFVANFMIKEPGLQSEVIPHQDWTYVDESKFMSLNLWIPLQKVCEENGCMTFLPKSHRLKSTLRTSPFFPSLFDNVFSILKDYMVPVPMELGEALVFSHATLHGSLTNTTKKRRLNVVQGIYNKDAQLSHFYTDSQKNNLTYQYEISVCDFYKIKDLKKPDFLIPVNEFYFDFPILTKEEFFQFYPDKKNKCFIDGLKNWLRWR